MGRKGGILTKKSSKWIEIGNKYYECTAVYLRVYGRTPGMGGHVYGRILAVYGRILGVYGRIPWVYGRIHKVYGRIPRPWHWVGESYACYSCKRNVPGSNPRLGLGLGLKPDCPQTCKNVCRPLKNPGKKLKRLMIKEKFNPKNRNHVPLATGTHFIKSTLPVCPVFPFRAVYSSKTCTLRRFTQFMQFMQTEQFMQFMRFVLVYQKTGPDRSRPVFEQTA